MFKNVTIFSISSLATLSKKELHEALTKQTFVECGPTQDVSTGWTPPRGEEHGGLAERAADALFCTLTIEKKAVPTSVVKDAVEKSAKKLKERTGVNIGRSLMKDLREQAILDLLPRAFPRRSHIRVMIDVAAGYLFVGSSSAGGCDSVISALLTALPAGASFSSLHTEVSLRTHFAEWIRDDETMPSGFLIGMQTELQGPSDQGSKSVARFKSLDLGASNVVSHLDSGKQPVQLEVSLENMSLVLTDDLRIKSIKRINPVECDDDKADSFDADLQIAVAEMRGLIAGFAPLLAVPQ